MRTLKAYIITMGNNMTANDFINHIIKIALSDNPSKQTLLRINLNSKKYLKGIHNISRVIETDDLHDALTELQKNNPWLTDLTPTRRDLVENINNFKFKLDLHYREKLATYSGYIEPPSIAQKKEWLDLIRHEKDVFSNFTFQHWGSNPVYALSNIKKAEVLLNCQKLSQHQLSAILTNNAKKITLKDIQDLITTYPELSEKIRPRKVIINYYAEHSPKHCLIVENMDTYHYLQGLLEKDWMLVCGFGYRVSKADISDLGIADLHAHKHVQDSIKYSCQNYWQDLNNEKLYWGDLDDEGELIFQALKKQYVNLKKWKPAYDAMKARQPHIKPECLDVHQEAILINELNMAQH